MNYTKSTYEHMSVEALIELKNDIHRLIDSKLNVIYHNVNKLHEEAQSKREEAAILSEEIRHFRKKLESPKLYDAVAEA